MTDVPRHADDYSSEDLKLVRSGCLEVATRLGDLMDDIVIVGGFVVLKAFACDNRGKDKDPYDLFYMLRNYGDGPEDVASDLQPYLDASEQRAYEAVEILERDFDEPHAVGPMAVSHFLYGERHADLEADVVAFVDALLRALEW